MPVYMGDKYINELYIGNIKIKEAYMGRVKIFPGDAPPYTGKEFKVETWYSAGSSQLQSITIPDNAKDLTVRIIGASAGAGYTNDNPTEETFYGEGSASGGFCECYYNTAFNGSTIYFYVGKEGSKGKGTSTTTTLSMSSSKGENSLFFGDNTSIPIQIAEGSNSVYDSYNVINEGWTTLEEKNSYVLSNNNLPTYAGSGQLNKYANGVKGGESAYNKNTNYPKKGLAGTSTVVENFDGDYASKCIRQGKGGKGANDGQDGNAGYIFIGYNIEDDHRKTTFPFEYWRIFESGSSYTLEANYIKDLTVYMVGGGGGAGALTRTGTDNKTISIGGGGGSGYYQHQKFSNITQKCTLYFQVGQGGSTNSNGTASIFYGTGSTPLLTAKGGNGGNGINYGTGGNNGTIGALLYTNQGLKGFGGASTDAWIYDNAFYSIYGKGGNGFSINSKGKGTNGYVFIGYNSDTQPEPPYTEPYNYIMVNNSVYYASVDGINWKTYNSPVGNLTGINFTNNLFIITGADGFATSSNGKDWTTYEYPSIKYSTLFPAITYKFNQIRMNKAGYYVAIAECDSSNSTNSYNDSYYVTTTDFITWTGTTKDNARTNIKFGAQSLHIYGMGTKSGGSTNNPLLTNYPGRDHYDSVTGVGSGRIFASGKILYSDVQVSTTAHTSYTLYEYLCDTYFKNSSNQTYYLHSAQYGSSSGTVQILCVTASAGFVAQKDNAICSTGVRKTIDVYPKLCVSDDLFLVYGQTIDKKNIFISSSYASNWKSYNLEDLGQPIENLTQVVYYTGKVFLDSSGCYSTDGINWTMNSYGYKSNLTTRVSIASRD